MINCLLPAPIALFPHVSRCKPCSSRAHTSNLFSKPCGAVTIAGSRVEFLAGARERMQPVLGRFSRTSTEHYSLVVIGEVVDGIKSGLVAHGVPMSCL